MWWIILILTLVFFVLLNGIRIEIKFANIKVWFEDEPENKYFLIPFIFVCIKRQNFEALRTALRLVYIFIRSISINVKLQ